jgi:hypothetical protein
MIKLNTAKTTLSLILPNTNKALKQVMQDATPKELEELSTSKDLKSVLSSILKKSSDDSSQNKLLLNLAKNNPTLKDLGNPTTTLKNIVDTLDKNIKTIQTKSEIQQAQIKPETQTKQEIQQPQTNIKADTQENKLQQTLKHFLNDIKDINSKTINTKLENSGVFLESKIKDLQTPKMQLKTSLQELTQQLNTTKLPNVKVINTELKNLLSSDLFKNISNEELFKTTKPDIKEFTQITTKVDKILDKLELRLNSNMDKTTHPNDTLFKESTKNILDKINLLNKPEMLSTQKHTQELFSKDLKSVLLQAHDDISNSNMPNKQELLKHIDKLTLQIDYNQLVSHLSNSSSVYIPYSWDELEDGNITLKKSKKNSYFCDIDLNLKNNGELKLRLGLFDENQLNINITATDKDFRQLIKENLAELKKQLFKVSLTPKSIRFMDDKPTSSYDNSSQTIDVGFEVKA